ncbi:MAG: hypothetical protein ABF968_04405 [Acetobacter sp.]
MMRLPASQAGSVAQIVLEEGVSGKIRDDPEENGNLIDNEAVFT